MKVQILLLPLAGVLATGAVAQTLGDAGAASAISGSMDGAGQGGTMAVGARAARDARRMGQTPYIGGGNAGNAGYMDDPYGNERGGPGGPAPGYGAAPGYAPAPGYGAGGSTGSGGGDPRGAAGSPSIPDPTGQGGSAEYGTGGAVAAPPPPKVPLRWGKETGEGFIDELRSRSTRARGSGRNPRGTGSVGSKMSQKQLARYPKGTRTKVIAQKYQKPPVGYLSYYLPEDRYKLTSGLWKFVTIEDDQARYPVKHYYRPDSPRFLSIVAQKVRGSQARFNRVLGFASWQDALIAGYRPDPVSKPAPGLELATIASIAPRTEAAHYAEFLYAGQISPEEFNRTYAYMLKVRGVINARPDTRQYLRPTMGQILLAALGEGSVPTSVGGPPRAVVTTNVGPGGYSEGSTGGYPGSSGSGYPSSYGGLPR